MKNKIILLLFGMFAFVADVVAAETSRYVEFARTYGIVRYFRPIHIHRTGRKATG